MPHPEELRNLNPDELSIIDEMSKAVPSGADGCWAVVKKSDDYIKSVVQFLQKYPGAEHKALLEPNQEVEYISNNQIYSIEEKVYHHKCKEVDQEL